MPPTFQAPLLVELFVEELPPKVLNALGEAFAEAVANGLIRHQLKQRLPDWKAFATPRRLAVYIPDVAGHAADRSEKVKLMPATIGLTGDGQATPALLKKLASLGADGSVLPLLERRADGKAEVLFFERTVRGATLAEGLQQALDEAIVRLPIPKIMQYQLEDGWTNVNFVRPAHRLVALHGETIVPVRLLGLSSGRTTQGHRFQAVVSPIALRSASSYEEQLLDEGGVIASFAKRRDEVVAQLKAAAAEVGFELADDPALVDEVTALVEKPNVLACEFEQEFLLVPPECLVLTMKANQKYFPLLDWNHALTHHFLVVSNIAPADPSRIIEGNERVIRPRLSDAKFFFDQDRKRRLESRVPALDKIVYHAKLGSQGERVRRVRQIAEAIGQALGGADLAAKSDRAAMLAKADLTTGMIGEFPELQGVMGCHYALHDREDEAVAYAVEDHYRPRFSRDTLPRNDVGVVVALADKFESLVGLFGIGDAPTGDKDPFALRRQAIGIIRILVERDKALDLRWLLATALEAFPVALPDRREEIQAFIYERLTVWLRESFGANTVEAVMARTPSRISEVARRVSDLQSFWDNTPEAPALAAANKRVTNILKKNTLDFMSDTGGTRSADIDIALLIEPAEKALFESLQRVAPQAASRFEKRDYSGSLAVLAELRAPVDGFFESVMVNVDDQPLRANRLGLLVELQSAMNRVADLSKLAS